MTCRWPPSYWAPTWSFILFFPQFYFLKILLTYFSRRKGGREKKKHQCVVESCGPPAGNLAHNPGTCLRLEVEPVTLWFADWCSIHSSQGLTWSFLYVHALMVFLSLIRMPVLLGYSPTHMTLFNCNYLFTRPFQ